MIKIIWRLAKALRPPRGAFSESSKSSESFVLSVFQFLSRFSFKFLTQRTQRRPHINPDGCPLWGIGGSLCVICVCAHFSTPDSSATLREPFVSASWGGYVPDGCPLWGLGGLWSMLLNHIAKIRWIEHTAKGFWNVNCTTLHNLNFASKIFWYSTKNDYICIVIQTQ